MWGNPNTLYKAEKWRGKNVDEDEDEGWSEYPRIHGLILLYYVKITREFYILKNLRNLSVAYIINGFQIKDKTISNGKLSVYSKIQNLNVVPSKKKKT